MGDYLQQHRKVRVTTPLGRDTLLLKGYSGTEALSQLFSYQLEMIAENKDKVPFEKLLGKRLTVHAELPDGSEHHVNGLCCRFVQGERDTNFTLYRAEVVPQVWLLTRRFQSRIFQRLNVPDILRKVFAGFPVDYRLEGTYEPRDFCVQYRESDFNFASRLMEEEGITYFFTHADGEHTMVLVDTPSGFPTLPGESSFIFETLAGGVRDENRIWAWERAQEIRSTKSTLWDHCFEIPHKHLEAETVCLDSVQAGKEKHKLKLPGTEGLEVYDWPGEYAQRFDGIDKGGGEQPQELQKIFRDNKRTVEIRMDEETAAAVTLRGASNVKHLLPGHRFKLKRHHNADGEYVLVGVTHMARFGADYRSGKESLLSFQNSFTAIPEQVRFRPRRLTAKPVVQGTQTAVVVGPKGEEIFTDKYGRVKVQFHWDREGKNDDDSSCWIRVGTHWAGQQWGAIHIPRIGQEVIVDFLEGDPDQPIVVGSVYNADTMPPWKLPDNKTMSGIKSRSTLKGSPADYNEIRFEDKKGKEFLSIHAQKDMYTAVERDHRLHVGRDDDHFVERDRFVTIKGKEHKKVDGEYQVNVGGNYTAIVGGDMTYRYDGGRDEAVKKTFSIKSDEVISLKAPKVYIYGTSLLSLAGPGGHIKIEGGVMDIEAGLVKINCGAGAATGPEASTKETKDIDLHKGDKVGPNTQPYPDVCTTPTASGTSLGSQLLPSGQVMQQ